jgi:DNA-binding SARP family transcriptional activator
MDTIIITTLGEFSITCGDNTIAEKDKRSKKMWMLLKYLTAFKERGVTQSEIIEILWDGEDLSNPAGALKTQLHRLRGSLDKALGLDTGLELVVSFSGTYAFNNSFEYIIDSAEFEKYYNNSKRDDISEKEQIGFIKKAFELYKGNFLMNSKNEKWLTPLRVYYHSIYIQIVHRLIDALFKHKQYAELINTCRRVLQIENTDQKIHILLIKSLAACGELDAAGRHYKYVMDMLYNELGVNPSPELRELYTQTINRDGALENDLDAIKQKLKEDNSETESGAFFCELEVFKSIYRLKMRDAERNEQKVQICLLTVTDPQEQGNSPKQIASEMKKLHTCVGSALRKSDIFARYSVSQFVLMLPSATEETGDAVINRITNRYNKMNSGFLLEIDFKHVMA